MNYSDIEIVLQEIPGEISICFTITGCALQCQDCHSPYLWKEENGKLLTPKKGIYWSRKRSSITH